MKRQASVYTKMEKLCWTLHYHVLYVPTYVFMSRKIYIEEEEEEEEKTENTFSATKFI